MYSQARRVAPALSWRYYSDLTFSEKKIKNQLTIPAVQAIMDCVGDFNGAEK